MCMDARTLLEPLREPWLNAATDALARGEATRAGLRPQLLDFFDRLLSALAQGDPTPLNIVVTTWAWSLTSTDLSDERLTVLDALRVLGGVTLRVVRRHLPPEQALQVLEPLLPLWLHAFAYAAEQELQAQMEHARIELAKVQQDLERLDRSKSNFVSVAAHELKTPLTLIEGYAAMLEDTLRSAPAPLREQSQPLLQGIHRGCERTREIVDNLIDVSLIDNNLLRLSFQPLWLHQLFNALVAELAPVLEKRHLTLSVEPFLGSRHLIFGDITRLQQAFRHLLLNAIKYTPDGGRITVDGRLLPGFVEVRISDTGIGIAPENQRLIFEKFGRVGDPRTHSSSKTGFKGGGPGLGLSIVKGIIEAHGGTIWVESPGYDEEKCPGSTFHVLLPLRSAPPDEDETRGLEQLAAYLTQGE